MGPKQGTQGHKYLFSTHFGDTKHVPLVQIWIMHIKCLQTW
jgi:hypothetical protein